MFLFRHDEKNKIFCYHRVFVLVCIILYTSTGGVKSRKMSETITVESDESDNSDDEKRIISTLSQMTGSSHVAHVDELAASNPSSPDQDDIGDAVGGKYREKFETKTAESDESDNSDVEKKIMSTVSQLTGSSHVAPVDELAASNPSSPDQDYTVSPFRVPLQRAASAPEHDLRKMPFLDEIESSLSHGCVSPFTETESVENDDVPTPLSPTETSKSRRLRFSHAIKCVIKTNADKPAIEKPERTFDIRNREDAKKAEVLRRLRGRAASVRDITTIDDSESPQPDRRRFSFMPFASKKSESTRRSERTS